MEITNQFSSKTTRKLMKKGFEKLEQLAEKTERELRLGGLNYSDVAEIKQVLEENEMKLKADSN